MPNRILRDWTDSDKINGLTVYAERFFVRLIMRVDDFGCFYADTRLLKANLFPLLLDTIREADLLRWIAECEKAGLIVLYENANKKYVQIVDFGQRLDKARARFPLPGNEEYPNNGQVYVMGENGSNQVKIGFSANPWARLKEVTQSFGKIVVLRMQFKGTLEDEKTIHNLLRKYATGREWFSLPESVLSYLSICYKRKNTATELIVAIRSKSFPAETETETKQKPNTKPKGSAGDSEIFSPKNEKENTGLPGAEISMPFAEGFKLMWDQWKIYKSKEFSFKYKSSQSEQASINELVNLANGSELTAVEIIKQSMAKGWKGFFELKNVKNESGSKNKTGGGKVGGEQLNQAFTKFYQGGK